MSCVYLLALVFVLLAGLESRPDFVGVGRGQLLQVGHELLNEQFDKIEDSVNFAYRRFPVLERTGVKRVIHGPFTFAPDGNPLIGPVQGLKNYWSACAVTAGFSQGGGMGLALAQWMG